jgi:hypothetical protein
LGIEVQQTVFGYDWTGALGNTVFMEFKILNKCSTTMESTYVSIWCDPDVGGASDDCVGCIPLRSLGFAYNATNSDAVYGSTPPCVGYDLLKGIVDERGWKRHMTSFSMYINSTDPRARQESYNYMRGLDLYGHAIIDPTTGEVTKYMLAGDPTTGTGWLDSDPADRRFMMTSGPFTMAPGDSQEIALAIVVARGNDRIHSVHLMKLYDAEAQYAYRFGQGRPVFPHFQITAGEEETHLTWVNPDDPAFIETLVRYSLEGYPEDPTMGGPVPNGNQGRFPGLPGTTGSFVHSNLEAGVTYYYAAFAFDQSGDYTAISVAEATPSGSSGSAGVTAHVPEPSLSLSASPNPSLGTVRFACSVTRGAEARLTIFNTSGHAVRTLNIGTPTGHAITAIWDGKDDRHRDLAAGIYFARLQSGSKVRFQKIVMIK